MDEPQEVEQVSLDTLRHGSVIELGNHALREAYENIQDPNTKATVARKVVITITLKPTEQRTMNRVEIKAETKLAPPAPVESTIYLSRPGTKVIATEYNPNQPKLPNIENVRNIAEGGKK